MPPQGIEESVNIFDVSGELGSVHLCLLLFWQKQISVMWCFRSLWFKVTLQRRRLPVVNSCSACSVSLSAKNPSTWCIILVSVGMNVKGNGRDIRLWYVMQQGTPRKNCSFPFAFTPIALLSCQVLSEWMSQEMRMLFWATGADLQRGW